VVDVLDNITNTTESRASLKRKAQFINHKKKMQMFAAQNASSAKPLPSVVAIKVEKTDKNAGGGARGLSSYSSYDYECSDRMIKVQKQASLAKARVAKAMEQTSNVGKRMAKIEELEKHLNLLDRIRPTIGEMAYETRVRALAKSLPNPESFSKDVEVIALDLSEDDDDKYKKKEDNYPDSHQDDADDSDDQRSG
jgi:hypothetical protein